MNTNTFLSISPDCLPISISIEKDGYLTYRFSDEPTEDDCLHILEHEMPGVLIGDYGDDSDGYHKSVFYENELFQIYSGAHYPEESEVWIKRIGSYDNIYKFYVAFFRLRNKIYTYELNEIGVITPEKLFWDYFSKNGYTEVERSRSMDSEGYDRVTIEFERDEITYYVEYPQKDYQPDSDSFHEYEDHNDYEPIHWTSFFTAILRDDIKLYNGFN